MMNRWMRACASLLLLAVLWTSLPFSLAAEAPGTETTAVAVLETSQPSETSETTEKPDETVATALPSETVVETVQLPSETVTEPSESLAPAAPPVQMQLRSGSGLDPQLNQLEIGVSPNRGLSVPPRNSNVYMSFQQAAFVVDLALAAGIQPIQELAVDVYFTRAHIDRNTGISYGPMRPWQNALQTTVVGDDYRMRFIFHNAAAGKTFRIPVKVKHPQYVVPSNHVIKIRAEVLGDGVPLGATAVKDLLFTVWPYKLTSLIDVGNGEYRSGSGLVVQGGALDPNDSSKLSSQIDEVRPVSFKPQVTLDYDRSGLRNLDRLVGSLPLPEGAVFVQSDNPEWVYDSGSNTATRTYTRSHPFAVDNPPRGQEWRQAMEIKLRFPGALLSKERFVRFRLTGHPNQPGPEEPLMESINTDASFTLKGLSDKGRLEKRVSPSTIKDVLDIKQAANPVWIIEYFNESENLPTENIVIRDMLPEAFYAETVLLQGGFDNILNGTLEIWGHPLDGSPAQRLHQGIEIVGRQSYAIGQGYKGIELRTAAGSSLKPSEKIRAQIFTKFRDPSASKTNDVDAISFTNQATAQGNYQGMALRSLDASASLQLVPVKREISLRFTSTRDGHEMSVGEINRFHARGEITGLASDDRPYLYYYVLLPVGHRFVERPGNLEPRLNGGSRCLEMEHQQNGYHVPQIINNYKGTNRQALFWDIKTLRTVPTPPGASCHPYNDPQLGLPNVVFEAEVTRFAEDGNNVSDFYVGWQDGRYYQVANGQPSAQDVYDMNANGETNDTLAHARVNTSFTAPRHLEATVEVKTALHPSWQRGVDAVASELDAPVDYRLSVHNKQDHAVDKLQMLNVLPAVSDRLVASNIQGERLPRQSAFAMRLRGPVTVPAGYSVAYHTEGTYTDLGTFLSDPGWKEGTAVSDWSSIRSIRYTMKDGVQLGRGESLVIEVPAKTPKHPRQAAVSLAHRWAMAALGGMGGPGIPVEASEIPMGALAYNSFGVSIMAPATTLTFNESFNESNVMGVKAVVYTLQGQIFEDLNKDGRYQADQDRGIAGHRVALVNAQGQPVLDSSGKPIQTVSNPSGHYLLPVYRAGEYKVQIQSPDGLEVLAPHADPLASHINQQGLSVSSFALREDQALGLANAGFQKKRPTPSMAPSRPHGPQPTRPSPLLPVPTRPYQMTIIPAAETQPVAPQGVLPATGSRRAALLWAVAFLGVGAMLAFRKRH